MIINSTIQIVVAALAYYVTAAILMNWRKKK